jgi:hypothetical protein
MDVTPYHVSNKMMQDERARILRDQKQAQRQAGMKLSGIRSIKNTYDFSEGHTVAEKSKSATAVQKKKKKKKKSQKARGQGQTEVTENTTNETKSLDERNKQKASNDKSTSGAAGQAFNNNETNDKKLPVSFDDWAKLILGRPQPDNVAKLVDYFKNGMVSGDVFYAITGALIEERNEKQQDLALYAVRQVRNLQSFEFLHEALKNENQGSNLAAKISDAFTDYKALASVGVLKSVISSHLAEYSYVQISVGLIDASTKENLENRRPSADDNTINPDDAIRREGEHRRRMHQIYSGFIPLLESVLATYPAQSEIAQPAQSALTRIKNLAVVVADFNG